MFVKYIIVICLTYFSIPAVKSNNQQLVDLFNAIKAKKNNFITLKDLIKFCDDTEDEYDLISMLSQYATDYGNDKYKMDFKQFKNAAKKGQIPKVPKKLAVAIYEQVTGAGRDYINWEDLFEHYYGPPYNYTLNTLQKILTKHGKWVQKNGSLESELGLKFVHFRQLLNLDIFPAEMKPENAVETVAD